METMGKLICVEFSPEMKATERGKGGRKRLVGGSGRVCYFAKGSPPPVPIQVQKRLEPEICRMHAEDLRIFARAPHVNPLHGIRRVELKGTNTSQGTTQVSLEVEFEAFVPESAYPECFSEAICFTRGEKSICYKATGITKGSNDRKIMVTLVSIQSEHPSVQENLLNGDFRVDFFKDEQVRSFSKHQLLGA